METRRVKVTLDVEVKVLDEDDIEDVLNDYFSPGPDGAVEIVNTEYHVFKA